MNTLFRGALVLCLVSLLAALAPGTLFAQEDMLNWDKTHPLEYHQAAVAVHEMAQSQNMVQNWDKTHPQEYYLALPTVDQLLAYLANALPVESDREGDVTCIQC